MYCWRPETDGRQPEGTVRSVTLEIPVSWDRTVNFFSNEWRVYGDNVLEKTGIDRGRTGRHEKTR